MPGSVLLVQGTRFIQRARRSASWRLSAVRARFALVSVIVPVYNVESYIADCLGSLLLQSHRRLQIIVVNDGSTDGSMRIARELAERDKRIRIINKPNGGLGAARNVGVNAATGKYITFVDSDDSIPSHAYARMAASLERSGSDIAIGSMQRIRPDGSRFVPRWVRRTHAVEKLNVTVEECPHILRDFYTPNKMYRARFWARNQFRFREGALFEDQPLITEVLYKARGIDVLTDITYRWLTRAGSLSQEETFGLDKVRERQLAVNLTKEKIVEWGSEEVRQGWLWTMLEFHLPIYLKNSVNETDEAYDAIAQMVRDSVSTAEIMSVADVSAENRVLVYLAHTGSRQLVSSFLAQGGHDLKSSRLVELEDGTWFVMLPFHDQPSVAPSELFRVPEHQQSLSSTLSVAEWDDAGNLTLSGWAYIENIDLGEDGPEIQLVLARKGSEDVIPLPIRQHDDFAQSAEYGHEFVNFRNCAFDAVLNTAALAREFPRSEFEFELQVTARGVTRRGPFMRRAGDLDFERASYSSSRAGRLEWRRLHGLIIAFP